MTDFKVGDKVVCIDADHTPLTVGNIYTIDYISSTTSYIHITGDHAKRFFYKRRFKLLCPIEQLLEAVA